MARPRKTLTKEQADEVSTLSAVLTIEQMADYFEMSPDTFHEIKKRQPEVFRAYKKGKAKAINDVAGNLVTQAKGGSVAAAIFYLKTQAGWSESKDDSDDEAPPLNITFNVSEAVKDVKVTNAGD
ncbi:MAG: hypothetical protein V2J13_02775 [Cycloclasticus sp.]|jgi:hypothetical protein|nr:hypothetical protein [Cycloclasticus sp.]